MTQSKNKLIAITGGIGSGKSEVSKILRQLGYTVYSADEVYAEILTCKEFVQKVHQTVGVITTSQTLDRKAVSEIVFSNPEKLSALNKLTHNKVMERLLYLSKDKGVVFNEVPLLFEGGFEKYYDQVIVVTRPYDKRVESIKKRDGISEEEITKRINSQFDYEKIEKDKHTVIINDLSVEELKSRVITALNEIL